VGLIEEVGLQSRVTLAGYVPEDELPAHFSLADLYIMPSSGEGFGIVFLEAMYYGLRVIAGNKDGSTDALLQGELGLLVNPSSVEEIQAAIEKLVADPQIHQPCPELLNKHFSYGSYAANLNRLLGKKVQVCLAAV
jgi:glycosyltransferase involved in cell wall biosynthesis